MQHALHFTTNPTWECRAISGCQGWDGPGRAEYRGAYQWRDRGRRVFTALLGSNRLSQTDPATCPGPWTPSASTWCTSSRARFFLLPEAVSSPSPNSSMTTRELQEYWRQEKGAWNPVKLLFEVASARIEETKASKFVVSGDHERANWASHTTSSQCRESLGPPSRERGSHACTHRAPPGKTLPRHNFTLGTVLGTVEELTRLTCDVQCQSPRSLPLRVCQVPVAFISPCL